jgi:hypothetical protein
MRAGVSRRRGLGNEDGLAVAGDLQVVEHRAEARDVGREVEAFDELAAVEVEGQETRLAAAEVGVVERPQPVLSVDAQGEHGLEGWQRVALLLPGQVGPGLGAVAAEHHDLGRRVSVGVQREEDPAVGRHGDIARRVVQVGDRFDHVEREARRRRAILEFGAPAEAQVGESGDHEQAQGKQGENRAEAAEKLHDGNS